MSVNERVQIDSGDIAAGQLAPSQASRTNFTPGKASAGCDEMNWPKDYRIPTGTPAFGGEAAGPVEMGRTRIVKLHRNSVSDQTLPIPVVTGTRIETRTEVGISGTNTTTDTETPSAAASQERLAGYDRIVGA